MAKILSLARFERDARTLIALRKDDRPPFAGQWLLPGAVVGDDESAEEALERHVLRELGVKIAEQEFAETLQLVDAPGRQLYAANVFHIQRHGGELRFRADGDYEDVRWLTADDLASLPMPSPLRHWLLGERKEPVKP